MMERYVVDMYDSNNQESYYDNLFTDSWVINCSGKYLCTEWEGQVLTLVVL